MNKQDWTYKKLGEVCEIYQPKTLSTSMLVADGKYAVYGANGIIGRYDHYNHESSEVLMTCRGATCGTINISEPFSWINGNAMVIHPQSDVLKKLFLVHALRGIDLSTVITGAAQPQITRQSLYPTIIPVPPIAEQERIVAELDLLQGIIEKKKEQLKAYDQLAQSIFYTMFGDPIDNPKGWEVKKLDELCTVITKGTTPTTLGFPFVEEGINFVKVESFIDGRIDSSKLSHITHECNLALSRSKLEDKDLLVCIAGATIGKMAVVDSSILPANTNQACAIIRLKDKRTIRYIQSFLELKFENDVMQMGKGVAQPNLSLGQLRNLFLPMPPIGQRETFTTTLEAIERQKTLVQQSIDETQTMFDCTMDKYFG